MTFSHKDFKYIDIHTHFFPPNIFEAIWDFFEQPDEKGNPMGWFIHYKLGTDKLLEVLEKNNVVAFSTLNYAHKMGVASFINDWTRDFVKVHTKAIPFGCIWPGDKDLIYYTQRMFDEYNFKGIKIQPLVQNFYPTDERMDPIYDMIVDKGKWLMIHAGTAPYRNIYVGFKNFIKILEERPNMNVIIAHLGLYEYNDFFSLLERFDNVFLDTAMVYIPTEIFSKWKKKIKIPEPELLLSYQDRILYGSDFPNIPYEYTLSTKGLLNLNLPKDFYQKIFYQNSSNLFLK